MEGKILINGKEFLIVRESTSNKNARASVDGSIIRIQIPISWPREEGFKAFLRLGKKILRKLEKDPLRFAKPKRLTLRDGQEVTVLGKHFVLRKEAGRGERTSSASCNGETVIVRLSPSLESGKEEEEVFSNLSRRVMASVLHSEVEKRVRDLNDIHFQAPLSKVFIKENATSFGSCSSKGNINLSFRVLLAPGEVLDYVIIHELAHLREKNHSPAFWALVEKAAPSYKQHRKWLRSNGDTTLHDFSGGHGIV